MLSYCSGIDATSFVNINGLKQTLGESLLCFFESDQNVLISLFAMRLHGFCMLIEFNHVWVLPCEHPIGSFVFIVILLLVFYSLFTLLFFFNERVIQLSDQFISLTYAGSDSINLQLLRHMELMKVARLDYLFTRIWFTQSRQQFIAQKLSPRSRAIIPHVFHCF